MAETTAPDRYRLVPQVLDGVEIRVFADAPTSMRELLVATATFGDGDFLVSGDERLTYGEHFDRVAGLAVRMRDVYGVRHGTRVAIAMRNHVEWVIAFWATQALGAVSVPLNACSRSSASRASCCCTWTSEWAARSCCSTSGTSTTPSGCSSARRVTAFSAVPTILRSLLSSPKLDAHDLSSLTSLAAGAAPVPADLLARMGSLRDGVGVARLRNHRGDGRVVVNAGAGVVDHPTSVGRPLPMIDVRIVDPETGFDRPQGDAGEIWFKGPNVIRGYWNDPAADAASFVDGWFRSGDLGYLDDEGLLFVVDRLKDVIIRGGQNIYCAEVEVAIGACPGVDDVAVLGLAHPTLGEEVAAVVVVALADEHGVSADVLRTVLAGRLAAYKVPAVFVLRHDPLPRTATGKVLKRQLRDEPSP